MMTPSLELNFEKRRKLNGGRLENYVKSFEERSKEDNASTRSGENKKIEKAARTPESPRGGGEIGNKKSKSNIDQERGNFFQKFIRIDKSSCRVCFPKKYSKN